MRIRRRLATFALLGLLAIPGALTAQSVTSTSATRARLLSLFGDLSADDDVQIVTPVLFMQEGSVLGVDGEVVEFRSPEGNVLVDLGEIRAVSVRSGHWLQGTLWGTGAGILVGSVTGLLVASFRCTSIDPCNQSERDGALTGGLVGAITGALTGYFFGSRSKYWRPVFP